MGVLSGLFERRFHPSLYSGEWGGVDTAAGVDVTSETGLRSTTVYACVRILAETVASLPLITYQRLSNGGKERAIGHPLYRLLHDAPNPEMSSFEFRETLMGHLCLWGNAYANIDFDRNGAVSALWALRPDRVVGVKRIGGGIWYSYRLPSGELRKIRSGEMLHIKMLSKGGFQGSSPIGLARQAIGLSLATEEYGARFFGNGAKPGGVLEHPGVLTDEAAARLKASWDGMHQGLEQSHRVAVLESGLSYKQVGIPPEDAQFLETRKFQNLEIARIFRVPPHMLADLDRASFSNIEHQSLEFVMHTIRPWLVRWEQEIRRSLMTAVEWDQYFVEFLVDGLLRGDIASRYEAYATARQNGWLSANDIRRLENMNPIENGDVYLVPLNMIPADEVGSLDGSVDVGFDVDDEGRSQYGTRTLPTSGSPPTPDPSLKGGEKKGGEEQRGEEQRGRSRNEVTKRHRLMLAHRRLFADVIGRVLRREMQDVGAAARKYLGRRAVDEFEEWLRRYYREDHPGYAERQILPVVETLSDLVADSAAEEVAFDGERDEDVSRFVRAYARDYGKRVSAMSEARVRKALERVNPDSLTEGALEAVEAEVGRWDDRVEGDALEEAVRSGNAVVRVVFLLAGRSRLRWYTYGENCPYCDAMSGKEININDAFLEKNTDFTPAGAEKALRVKSTVRHAPLHRGCDCQVGAA